MGGDPGVDPEDPFWECLLMSGICWICWTFFLLTFTPLSLVQIEQLQFVRQQLCSPGLGPEGQPVPPEGALAPEQQAAEFRSGAAVSSAGESTLRPGDSEVSRGLVSHSEGERLDGRTRTRTLV